jgi:peptidoglycan/xylan/chitin deacetylase (PgdA/CDA1 family)
MTWVQFVLGQSRGPRNMATRLPTIVARFGLGPRKSLAHLAVLLGITDRWAVRPTLPVTAVVARRHPQVMHWLADRGVELAAHGYVHNDYAALAREAQFEQVQRAHDAFLRLGLRVQGWRCPYSRWNAHTLAAVRAAGFAYDATPTYAWPAYAQEHIVLPPHAAADYARLCRLFGVADAGRQSVLPTMVDGLVQIPMSIPQDEDMVDRVHLDAASMSRVWRRVLQQARQRRDIVVLCVHPERAALCAAPLDATLGAARGWGDVWLAPLGEIAAWWRERAGARVTVHAGSDGRWHVAVQGPSQLVTSRGAQQLNGSGVLTVTSPHKPVIGAGPAWPAPTLQRLHEAGYLCDCGAAYRAARAPHYALDLDRALPADTPPDAVVRFVAERDADLVRVQPWPAGYRSCLSVTGDIDAMTLFDFALRVKEF